MGPPSTLPSGGVTDCMFGGVAGAGTPRRYQLVGLLFPAVAMAS
ncbi:hypothetical protein KXU33_13735 [Aeromonas veronii]|nr:hypothetical protein [Aeromonas veronii]